MNLLFKFVTLIKVSTSTKKNMAYFTQLLYQGRDLHCRRGIALNVTVLWLFLDSNSIHDLP